MDMVSFSFLSAIAIANATKPRVVSREKQGFPTLTQLTNRKSSPPFPSFLSLLSLISFLISSRRCSRSGLSPLRALSRPLPLVVLAVRALQRRSRCSWLARGASFRTGMCVCEQMLTMVFGPPASQSQFLRDGRTTRARHP